MAPAARGVTECAVIKHIVFARTLEPRAVRAAQRLRAAVATRPLERFAVFARRHPHAALNALRALQDARGSFRVGAVSAHRLFALAADLSACMSGAGGEEKSEIIRESV